ncbi:MAG: PepSY-like domain-containing protein [Bacteroidetes bacterium]|uniref:PepSY-like domain-containing protein n=1 Tax=Candidatus Gallipaludibacter merdavium TaxID=2840839 RepID=A0A9D9HSL2_9BACT|nr:PepSY-like domain-containing protein [Candidatus Gallipaludibacter merdavium]
MRKFLWGMLIALMMAGMQSCENNTNFGNISPNKLPNAAKSFIEQYFADQTIVAAEKEMDDGQIVYEVTLSDGTELDFDENGEWTDVDCQNRQVPDGIVPEKIRSYVATNYPDNFIVEIEHKYNRYRIELNNDKYGASPIELRFDNQFNYTGDTNPAKAITVEQLPDTSSTFVEQFFSGIEVVYAEKDEDDGIITYELTLADGTEIEVDANGNWIEIECFRRALPDGIVPQPIVDYVAQNYPNGVIVTIERDDNGYEIELRDGTELKFDNDLNFVGGDNDDWDDDREVVISFENLPANAQAFLNGKVAENDILRIIEKTDDGKKSYEVKLVDGTELEFNSNGEWIEIDAEDNKSVADIFVPEAILSYVTSNYPTALIENIERMVNGYFEVELNNDVELYFDAEYNFVGSEKG